MLRDRSMSASGNLHRSDGGLSQCLLLAVRVANRNFDLVMKASVISRKQCPNRAPAAIETGPMHLKRRGSSFLDKQHQDGF